MFGMHKLAAPLVSPADEIVGSLRRLERGGSDLPPPRFTPSRSMSATDSDTDDDGKIAKREQPPSAKGRRRRHKHFGKISHLFEFEGAGFFSALCCANALCPSAQTTATRGSRRLGFARCARKSTLRR